MYYQGLYSSHCKPPEGVYHGTREIKRRSTPTGRYRTLGFLPRNSRISPSHSIYEHLHRVRGYSCRSRGAPSCSRCKPPLGVYHGTQGYRGVYAVRFMLYNGANFYPHKTPVYVRVNILKIWRFNFYLRFTLETSEFSLKDPIFRVNCS